MSKESFIVTLSLTMIKRIAVKVVNKLKEENEDIYNISSEQIYLAIDDVTIVNYNGYCSPQESEDIYKEVVDRLFSEGEARYLEGWEK